MRVVVVLRSGGDFKPAHVTALQAQLARWAPNATLECLTDMRVDGVPCRPLRQNWPGWWSKLELFDPAFTGDFLFMDLDTVVIGPLDDISEVKGLTLLRDFYRDGKRLKEGLGSGLCFLPEETRREVWDVFMTNPPFNMRLYARGDQHFLERFWLNTAARWQDVVPGQVVSWKVHCQNGIPPDARIVCFHGKPRPFEVGQFLHLYR